jgi:hypothetical protein
MLEPHWQRIWTWLLAHQDILGWAALLSLLMFVVTLIIIPLIVISLPRRYLVEEGSGLSRIPGFWRWPYLFVKNGVGAGLLLAGLAMLILPGQGLLTLLIGLSLMNFPGKRRLIRKIISQRKVFESVNRLRAKARKPPLEVPEERVAGQ